MPGTLTTPGRPEPREVGGGPGAVPPRPLTARQSEIIDFIRDHIRRRGYAPSVREIGREVGITSPNGVMCHLKALRKKGLIREQDGHGIARSAVPVAQDDCACPTCGRPFGGTDAK